MLQLSEIENSSLHPELNFVFADVKNISADELQKLSVQKNICLYLQSNDADAEQLHNTLQLLASDYSTLPFVLVCDYESMGAEQLSLNASTDAGCVFITQLASGLCISSTQNLPSLCNRLAFGILQGTRRRISKTEYISCPSCGRTLFNLQETTAKIRAVTNHLKGVKIAIMGCIVNGPGEMADADYGYVGTGAGKITLYKGREVVKRNIEEQFAVDELVQLIREYGDWVEKPL